MTNTFYYNSPTGLIKYTIDNNALTSLLFIKEQLEAPSKNTPLSNLINLQLDEYFKGKRKNFDIKINSKGTNFQKKVWDEISKVPYGKTKSYGELAQNLGNKKLSQVVGFACGKNPILIIVPCHRIVSKNGNLTGYSAGIEIKKYLLNLECGKL